MDKSLVAVEPAGEERRYDLLVSIREYGRERLAERGEVEATATQHARFYADFVQALALLVAELEDAQWRTLLASELDNVRAAIDWTVVQGHDPAVGLQLLADIEWPEQIVPPHEAVRWYDAALAREDAMPRIWFTRDCWAGVILGWFTGRATADRERHALRAVYVAPEAAMPMSRASARKPRRHLWHRRAVR